MRLFYLKMHGFFDPSSTFLKITFSQFLNLTLITFQSTVAGRNGRNGRYATNHVTVVYKNDIGDVILRRRR